VGPVRPEHFAEAVERFGAILVIVPDSRGLITVDVDATRRRIRKLSDYVTRSLLDGERFRCPHQQECRASRHAGDDFREGIMSHVGQRYDLSRGGRPLRIMVVGQESGLPKGPDSATFSGHVSLEARYEQVQTRAGQQRRYTAQDGFAGRNPHMRGTTSALRVLLGDGPGKDYEGEFIYPANDKPFHVYDGFALVNRLLCSAGPQGSSQGRSTPTMRDNCAEHFTNTLSILEPTLVVLQGAGVAKWTRALLEPVVEVNEHLYEASPYGNPMLVCQFSHPSAHGQLRWGDRLDAPYLVSTVMPTLRAALQRLETPQPGPTSSAGTRELTGARQGAPSEGSTVGDLFEREPYQWGLRGDAVVWTAMRSRLEQLEMPATAFELERLLASAFKSVVGIGLETDEDVVHRPELERGGMSSGQVHLPTWKGRLIPILIDRSRLT